MQKITVLFFALLACQLVRAHDKDSVNQVMRYETGVVQLSSGIAQLVIPQGFKYLNKEQSQFVLTRLWSQPPQPDMVGMLFPADGGPCAGSSYAFVIDWKPMGYVQADNAGQIDYDQLLQTLQQEEVTENEQRNAMGFAPVHLIRWVQKPWYDETHKALYWAKEVQSGETGAHAVHYDICMLGRKGILSMSAVSNTSQVTLVKNDISKLLGMAVFNEGNRHIDFDPAKDRVAAWTFGSLVTGKILNQPEFLVFLQKSLHLVVVLLVAVCASIVKFFNKPKETEAIVVNSLS